MSAATVGLGCDCLPTLDGRSLLRTEGLGNGRLQHTTSNELPPSSDEDDEEAFVAPRVQDSSEMRGRTLNAQEVVERSCKLRFIDRLLPQLFAEGPRILIFSQSCKMLSLVERMVLRPNDHRYLRLDGSVTKPEERQRRVDEFNKDERIGTFLLSTRVGGEGITLTGADRKRPRHSWQLGCIIPRVPAISCCGQACSSSTRPGTRLSTRRRWTAPTASASAATCWSTGS